MGAILSKNKGDSNDYEKILSELDSKIQKIEIKLSDIKVRQRRTSLWLVLIGTIVWVTYGIYYLLIFRNESHKLETTVLTTATVFALPVIVYYTRKLLVWFYMRRQDSLESALKTQRTEQKLKVEELKKKTSYYSTQSLLERYDPLAAKKKKELSQNQQQQHAQPSFQHPQLQQQQARPPVLPKYPDQHLRERRSIGLSGPESHAHPYQPQPTKPAAPQWIDKLVDALIGEDGPETKYALICSQCCSHNGLVLPSEVETIQYVCRQCKKFNPSRESRRLHPDGTVVLPGSPLPPSSPASHITAGKGMEEQGESSQQAPVNHDEETDDETSSDNEHNTNNEHSAHNKNDEIHDKNDNSDDSDKEKQASVEKELTDTTSVAERVVKRRGNKGG